MSAGETKRKLLHVAMGGFAFLLRFLTWPQAAALAAAAFAFNWQVLPRIGGRGLWRGDDREKGYPLGILLYPLAVLALVLSFRDNLWKAAAVWSILAFGDGMAGLLGQWLGGPRLPWNGRKGWTGFAALLIFGTAGAAILTTWTQRLPLAVAWSPRVIVVASALALLCALVESVPTTLDDNLTVPLVGGLFLALVAEVDLGPLLAQGDFGRRVLLGLAINLVLAAGALAARSIDLAGAVSAVIIGTTITAGLGLRGLALMIAFFVLGSAVTKVGYRVKASRGIAQEKGGARGWRNAWANGGVPALLAFVAGAFGAEMWAFGPFGSLERLRYSGHAWLVLTAAYAASVATAAADTCSSEIGKAYGRRTFLITSLKPVAPGTEGAISLEGTLGGLAGASIIALAAWWTGLLAGPTVAVVALAGLLGSLAESVLGTVAERRGWMGNDLLNALNTAVGAGIGATLAHLVEAAPTVSPAVFVLGP
jgi:uncharacterized protein (TIGR00297 family)